MRFSVIIPVYNRPDELAELLDSLTRQTRKPDEVVVVEDGSVVGSRLVVDAFAGQLTIQYIVKKNGGQGFARNDGFRAATGDYFVVFDSDALVPPHYFQTLADHLARDPLDAYGGPDAAHPDFTPVQRAIGYAMTSPFTTGGIRGSRKNLGGQYHPRSFNMGLSRAVWVATGGYRISRMGEDIEFAIRIIRAGFRTGLIPDAFIYHKRRTDFGAFFRQLQFFGRARINIARLYPDELKLVHWFPLAFTGFLVLVPVWPFVSPVLAGLAGGMLLLFALALLLDSLRQTRSWRVAGLSVVAGLVQLTGYGIGFAQEGLRRWREPRGYVQTGEQIEYPS
jgi:glycosyltransferase involved in cell wall biosynthesis